MKQKNIFPRVLFYALGLLFMAFGVAFSVNSGLGVSPVNSLPYVVSQIVNVEMGTCVIVVFSAYILAQILLLRSKFRLADLSQLLFSTLFGYFVDFAKWVVGSFTLPGYIGSVVMLAVSILLVAIGVSLYMGVKLINMPMEGMTYAISQTLFHKPFHTVKVMVDSVSVLTAAALSLIFLGKLDGIREGTVLCALLIGRLLPFVNLYTVPVLGKFCFANDSAL